ncbi:MAG TPA: hypothetical protein PK847_05555 [Candidatus Sumerlaeota bacterium]|nr:hypothetical protein [Candidatus Sumerlaeota bacterium]
MNRFFCIALLLAVAISSAAAQTVTVSGGGTAFQTVWNNATPGITIEITDSLTYLTDAVLVPATPATHNNVTVRAAAGQTPTIRILHDGALIGLRIHSGVENLKIGSNDGGRITFRFEELVYFGIKLVDVRSVTLENLDLIGTTATADTAVYITQSLPAQTQVVNTIVVDNCLFRAWVLSDGAVTVHETPLGGLYNAANDITFRNCVWEENVLDLRLRAGNDHGSFATRSTWTLENCRILNTDDTPGSWGGFHGEWWDVILDRTYIQYAASSGGGVGDLNYNTHLGVGFQARDSVFINAGLSLALSSQVSIDHCDFIMQSTPITLAEYVDSEENIRSFEGVANIMNTNFINQGSVGFSMGDTTTEGNPTLLNDYNNCPQGYQGKWVAGPHDQAVNPNYVAFPDNLKVQAPELIKAGSDGRDIGSYPPPPNRSRHWLAY